LFRGFTVKIADCAEKEEIKEDSSDQYREGRVSGGIGDASAGPARGEQEACKKRQAQNQPGQVAGRSGPWLAHPFLLLMFFLILMFFLNLSFADLIFRSSFPA
jgi:hypothetical protein